MKRICIRPGNAVSTIVSFDSETVRPGHAVASADLNPHGTGDSVGGSGDFHGSFDGCGCLGSHGGCFCW